jgi:putative peptidoglycan lipid II flippase
MTDSAPDYPLRSVSTAVALCTLLSRATGFVRVVAVASVLGSGALADVYQSANLLPNLLFELAAGGVLQAILLPSFVAAQVGDDGLADAYGAVVGWVGGALAAVTAGALALALPIGWLLTSTEPSAPVRAEKLDVMVPMLVMFLPQIVLYGLSTMAGAALAVKGRFLAAALAPALGNLIVIAGCLAFRSLRDAAVATLDITAREFLLVAGATTLGVVALAAVPLVALSRAGVRLRPTWQPGHPAVLRLRATVGWAALTVMATFVPTLLAIVLGNAVEGGVAIFVYAFAFFALPHSLIAVTVATTSAPRAAHRWHAGQRDQLRIDLDRAWAVMVPPLCLAAAGLMALAWPVARSAAFGQTASQGVEPIAMALIAFGPGVICYGASFVLLRWLLAMDDVRRCAGMMVVAALVGAAGMCLSTLVVVDRYRAAALAIGYGFTQLVAALVMRHRLNRLTGAVASWPTFRPIVQGVISAAVSAASMVAVVARFDTSRRSAVVAVFAAGTVGVVVFAAVLTAVRRGRPIAG